VVRADGRTGRLVRRVVVSPKPVPENVVKSRPVAAKPKSGPPSGQAGGLDRMIDETARLFGVEPALVHSVIQVESNYNRFAVSPKGAEGLMQLMPATARRFGVSNSFDAQKNIEAGVRYLKHLQGLYPNDLRHVLAAYNAGEGAVAKYNGIPRYPETVNYVYQVGKKLGQNRAAAARSLAKPAEPPKPAAPEHRPLQHYQDAEGRLYLKTP
jgi:soluble lytic murein transglycosylase-like protein